ncbi:hypothetical protein HJC10_35000 [Corallococcus exiguus]|uniref:hypothetical protein n=1 Tax=Corallococcus TaxID=83461 RepID=UPI000EA367A2|nr:MULTISPECIES: hypothetical protein [Corallococcus]NNB86878.1 hypothetical protein [Corallococcus exiguus]NNB94819.1 hypothetical protein [Corallococcus exiguus]NNC08033.1 hypothetical protein [Corallococcus exiguus]NPC52280.1 hypothetical protein [Corallococcus exiguus]RKH24147.1 hypothetical protein D7V77_21770 [Corallococcus sp. CA041A]
MRVWVHLRRIATAVVLCVWLAACGGTRGAVAPPSREELPRQVLLLREAPDGSFTQEWRPAEDFDLAHYVKAPEGRRIVRTARSVRDCDAENRECIQECMSRPLGSDFSHITKRPGLGGKEEYCVRRCKQPYLDCIDLEKLRPQELSSLDAVSEWARRNQRAILVGSVVVIAGVAFVVVSAGVGLIVLAPALLLTTSSVAPAQHLVESAP